jgi:hypothetical protein
VTLDPAPLGVLAANLMETLEREYGEQADDATIRAAMVLVDVGAPDEDGDHWTHVRWRFAAAGDDWDADRSSSAYAAGVVAEAFTGLTEGEAAP